MQHLRSPIGIQPELILTRPRVVIAVPSGITSVHHLGLGLRTGMGEGFRHPNSSPDLRLPEVIAADTVIYVEGE